MKRTFLHFLKSRSGSAQFARFAAVGMKMFLVDAAGTYLLKWLVGMSPYTARAISFPVALVIGYFFNRYFTFHGFIRGDFFRQMMGHLGVHAIGGLINYGFFCAVVIHVRAMTDHPLAHQLSPLAGIAIGGVLGMCFNFILSKRLVFRAHKENEIGPSEDPIDAYPEAPIAEPGSSSEQHTKAGHGQLSSAETKG